MPTAYKQSRRYVAIHNYHKIIKFTLVDKKKRRFNLENLTKTWFPHLGKESYYDLGIFDE